MSYKPSIYKRDPKRMMVPGPGAYLLDYKGYLAFAWGWEIDTTEPRYKRQVKVSPLKVVHESRGQDFRWMINEYSHLSFTENMMTVRRTDLYSPLYFDTTTWKYEWEYKPYPKPRRGKTRDGRYDWLWNSQGYSLHGCWEAYYLPEEE